MNSSRILGDLGITDAKSADRLCPDTCEGRFARSPLSSSRLLFYESQVLASHVLCPSSRAFACAQLDLDCALRLLSGDLSLTLLELITLGGLAAFAAWLPPATRRLRGRNRWSLCSVALGGQGTPGSIAGAGDQNRPRPERLERWFQQLRH